MKTLAVYDELKIPTYALSYLVNGDASGLEERDIRIIDRYMQEFYDIAKQHGGHVIFSCENDTEAYFTWHPEFGLACEVEDCTILIVK